FAGIGSATGVLPPALDAAIIVMVIVTTFIAPPLLQIVFQRSPEQNLPQPEAIAPSPKSQ
ncbi:MAG: cation:proton antiporter, partial [Chroococcidiopsis sp.]